MNCISCGKENAAQSLFCVACGTPLPVESSDETQQAATGFGAGSAPVYVGFWMRFVAKILDGIILQILQYAVMLPVGLALGMGTGVFWGDLAAEGEEFSLRLIGFFLTSLLVSISISWLYTALMLSSSKQATLGKMAIGAVVTDTSGNRLSFLRATGRHFAEILSALTLGIGYLIQPFTEKRQALHDIVAGTLVVRKPY